MKAKDILFRPSEVHQIMSKPRTKKTNADRYAELERKLEKARGQVVIARDLSDNDTELAAAEYNVAVITKQLKELEPLKDLPNISATAQKFLKRKYVEIMYGRRAEIDNKYMRKGRDVEEDSITLYSLIKNRIFKNNKERRENAYFTGEIDIPIYNAAGEVEEISDIKSSYDACTFIDNLGVVKAANRYQGLAYMDLYPHCQKYNIANVLTDNTDEALLQVLYYESFKWADNEVPNWREIELIKHHKYSLESFNNFISLRGCQPKDDAAKQMYHTFVEIPLAERLIEHTFERDQKAIEEIKMEIDKCREWMRIMFKMD